ncbi:PREDICTED: translation initiation factor IF-2-like [Chinchilla lanigera]|uniref:translation initiation factor IF-2-like n=1 Tax=Chinchilla lanigera TaxID=34839 RepID=UPI0006973ECF|nr:PREDICTED: translation initiation factor IF-2-like [Chinchilla lanigera]
MLVATWAVVTLVIWKQLFFLAGILDMVGRLGAEAPRLRSGASKGGAGPESKRGGRRVRGPAALTGWAGRRPRAETSSAPLPPGVGRARAPPLGSLRGGPGASAQSPRRRERGPRGPAAAVSAAGARPAGPAGVGAGGGGRRREGRRCLSRCSAGAGGGARLSDAAGGEERRVRSRGPGLLAVGGGLRAGGRAALAPGSAGAQPQGHAGRERRKPAPGEGRAGRSSLTGSLPRRRAAATVSASPRGSAD